MPEERPGLELNPLSDALNGTVIDGRYVLRTMIARGSMGRVYQAEQRPLGRTVAIKILDIAEEQVEGEGFSERFLREASTLAKLSDPHTVRIFDFGIWEGRSYLVMEYIDGQPLSTIVRRRPLPPLEAISIGMQICSSLAEAHKLGVVHRDLKLSNILVTRRDSGHYLAKVIDFGLVKEVAEDRSELTAVGQILGSPMYMAPEQIRAETIDQRADLYALGVVLYRMLLGERPFNQKGTHGLLFAHLNSEPRSFTQANAEIRLPGCVEWTVMRCLEKEAQDRFGSAGELRRALKACRIAIEEPTLSALTMELRDGATILPPELSDINSMGSLVSSQSASLRSVSMYRAANSVIEPAPKKNSYLLLGLGALLMLAVGAIGAGAVAMVVIKERADAAFVPIQSPSITAEVPDAAPLVPEDPPGEPAVEEPAAEPVQAEPAKVEAPAAPARSPRKAASPRPDSPPPAEPDEPAEEPVAPTTPDGDNGDEWEEKPSSDLVDPWSE